VSFLDQISPEQRKLAVFGAIGVGALALITKSRTPAAPASSTPTYYPTPSTDAIGVGQLAEFEDGISAMLSQLSQHISDLENTVGSGGGTQQANTTTVQAVGSAGETAAQMAARLNAEGKRMTMGNQVGGLLFAEYLLFVNALGAQYQPNSPLPVGRLMQF